MGREVAIRGPVAETHTAILLITLGVHIDYQYNVYLTIELNSENIMG